MTKTLNVVLKASGNLHISVWRQPFFSFCYCFLSCTQLGTVSTSQQVIKVRERSCLLYTREVQKHNSFSISLLEEVLPINIIHTSKHICQNDLDVDKQNFYETDFSFMLAGSEQLNPTHWTSWVK